MSKILYMPEVLANTTHAVISRWLVKEGDEVKEGQCIAEIETDKAVIDLLAEEDLLITRLIAEEGEEVAVGAPIAQLNGEGDLAIIIEKDAALEEDIKQDKTLEYQVSRPVNTPVEPRIFASPLARRLALQHHLELASLQGTGPNGRIIKRDIEKALGSQPALKRNTVTLLPASNSAGTPLYDVLPLSNMRKTIARRLTESKQSIPHFYLTVDCKVSELLQLRTKLNDVSPVKISVNDLIVKAVGLAMKEVPEINASFEGDKIHQYHHSDISIAVATDNGIQTPIIQRVEEKTLVQIHNEISELASLARESRLLPHQYQGGGFSISNLGMYGVDSFSAIINPPQAGILAVGTVRKIPEIIAGALVESSVISCTLSVDHRVVDGAKAAQWLASFKTMVEKPISLFL